MKRRVISFITSLALCLGLCSTWALATSQNVTMKKNTPNGTAYNITYPMKFDGGGYTYTVPGETAMSVQNGGSLTLINGTVKSGKGAGVEVKSGGVLTVTDPGVTVIGTTYGLAVFSGAEIQLSGGTFTASNAKGVAIWTEDDRYDTLLMPGYAFFDESGNMLLPEDISGLQTVVVKECTDHVYDYAPTSGAPTHDWTCKACGTKGTAPCTFSFDADGAAVCADCGRTIKIGITVGSLVYDGTDRPESVAVTVTLDDGKTTLIEDPNYTVVVTPGVNAGEIAIVTVTGITYIGTYQKTYPVAKAQPKITWEYGEVSVDYSGVPADRTVVVQEVHIDGIYSGDQGKLKEALNFSYREKDSNAAFTDGLPTDAGTYEIKASLPEQKNYNAVETETCLKLTIKKIAPIIEAPKAINLTYNRTAQELVTPGTVRDGAEIQFALVGKDGNQSPWSKNIPTGTDAGTYTVYYKAEETNNFNSADGTISVTIARKPVTPDVKLEYTSTVYDGGEKEPTVTVTDTTDNNWVLPTTEYKVKYESNRNVGTATVTVTDTDAKDGNYDIQGEIKRTFQITAADQDALTITNQPDKVCYGDTFTLGTVGGSGNGNVEWAITGAKDAAGSAVASDKIAEIAVITEGGQVTVKGLGSFTVKATKSGTDSGGNNHAAATAEVTFRVDPKRVVAVVTAANKTYNGNATATVTAEVPKQELVFDDIITITKVTGTFSDANAGTNKSVTVNISDAEIDGDKDDKGYQKYIVTIPATPVRADITKAATSITTIPTTAALTYNGTEQPLLSSDAGASFTTTVENTVITVEYALSESGPYSTVIPKATNAGSYEVWYRVRESDNYFGTAAKKVDVTIAKKAVTAYVTLESNSYVYDGTAKEPTVTVKEGAGTDALTVSSDEYTVTYSNNVNAGAATVTVTAKADGNYTFTTVTETFTITPGGQAVLTSSPQARNLTYNGQEQELVTVGTATGGYLVYALKADNTAPDDSEYESEIPNGTNAGEYTVYYKVRGNGNYEDSDVFHVSVTIQPKTVTSPVITLAQTSFTYDGGEQKPTVNSVVDGGDTIPATEYTVTYSNNINAGTATVHIVDNNGGNYNVSGSTTFEITKATASFTTDPVARSLTYNAKAQPLITAGVADGGTAVYWLEGGAYSAAVPTGTDCGTYTIHYQVLGDSNHTDSIPGSVSVTIAQNTVQVPKIELSSNSFRYNGSEQKPTVTVWDDDWNVIPANEYTVTYGKSNESTVEVGTYTITVTSKRGGNYSFSDQEKTVKILEADQTPLEITGKPGKVYYGDTIQLSTTGGSGNGTVTWSIVKGETEGWLKKGQIEGQFIITGVGDITVKATRTPAAGSGYAVAETTWTFHAFPKPVTAVVTAKDKVYDGTNTTELKSVAVPGIDSLKIQFTETLTGTFDSSDVGTNKTVTFGDISSKVTVTGGDNYEITYPETTTASITPAPATVTGVTANNRTYDGSEQALVTAGTVTGGYVAYSTDGINYSLTIPKATNAGEYEVWYKVIADSNHKDIAPMSAKVTISAKQVSPIVTCSPASFPYDGTQKTPNIIVTYKEDDDDKVIPASEYTVVYPQDCIAVNTYMVTVNPGSNYTFTTAATGTFSIVEASQAPLSIVTDKAPTVYYGDTFRLSAIGGSGNGAIVWGIAESTVATITDGVVEVIGIGSFTVTAYRTGDSSYNQSNEDSITFTANPKPVTAVVTAKDKVYNGDDVADLSVTVPGTDLVISGVTGTFADKNVGTNKTVTILSDSATATGTNSDKYVISYPETTTASITPAPTSLAEITVTANTLTYDGTPQALVTASGTATGGNLAYSLDGTNYSLVIPKETNAGTYKVWYKVRGDSNHMDSEATTVDVTIEKATPTIASNPIASSITAGQLLKDSTLTGGSAICDGVAVPGTFTWTNGDDAPTETGQCEVTFTPMDRVNYNTIPTKVTVEVKDDESAGDDNTSDDSTGGDTDTTPSTGNSTTPPSSSGPSAESASTQTSVRNGTAKTVLNTAAGDELVNEAVANGSENVVIKPEITGNVTKTEVSLPSSAVSRLGSETNASLTVSTPIADVTIPNESLDTLSGTGGTVSIVMEQVESTVVLTLTVGGKDVGNIPGGLTLTVSVENIGPGTVAVLIYEDGTRETIRWSVAEAGGVRIPLNGSATVEIVDNSKEFVDVPAENWAADAVAFASAHELFNGTGEATFGPELAMNRAMLATVLYNLEGRPDQELTEAFSDVSSNAWYAASVLWAAANGVVEGYGDGQFGPNVNITREQIAVMLWRYAGSPATDEQSLNFTDAGQASSYAMEALCWAAANGIMNGHGDGRLDPGGLATRAQAAQMLKNFIENA